MKVEWDYLVWIAISTWKQWSMNLAFLKVFTLALFFFFSTLHYTFNSIFTAFFVFFFLALRRNRLGSVMWVREKGCITVVWWPRACMPRWLAVMGKKGDNPRTQHKQTSLSYLVTCSQPSALPHPGELAPGSTLSPELPDRTIPPRMKAVNVQKAAGHQFCNDLLRAALLSLPVRENEIKGIWKQSSGWLGKSDRKVTFLVKPVCSVIVRASRGQSIEAFSGSGTTLLTTTYTEMTCISYLTDQLYVEVLHRLGTCNKPPKLLLWFHTFSSHQILWFLYPEVWFVLGPGIKCQLWK